MDNSDNNKQMFLNDCKILGLRSRHCTTCHLARRNSFYDLSDRQNIPLQYMEWIKYTQIPANLQMLTAIFGLGRKYDLVPEKHSSKVDELLTTTKEVLERFDKENLHSALPHFFAERDRKYLHDINTQWHRWANQIASCWTPEDLFITQKVT